MSKSTALPKPLQWNIWSPLIMYFCWACSTNRFYRCTGDRFCRRLDHTISLLLEKWHPTRREGGRKKAESSSSTIHFNKWRLIQKRFLPPLRCLCHKEADYIMREVHEGICGNHSGSWSLVHKLVQAGYYWPTMQKDAQTYVKACDKC